MMNRAARRSLGRLFKYFTLGSVGDVVTQFRPPQLADFGGGGIRSPIVINGTTGEAFIYVNGVITSFNSVGSGVINVKGYPYGAVGNGVVDDTAAIQAAVNAAGALGWAVYFPPGNYKITAQINILKTVYIYARPFSATIYIGAANINGFVIGDGTQPTNTVTTSTCVDGLQFAVLSTVPACTSGACIWINFAHYSVIRNVSLVGTASAKTLWNGLLITESLEWFVIQPLINGFRNNGIRITGTLTKTCGDGRIDIPEVIGCLGDATYMGDYTGAITYNSCIHDNNVGWNIKIDCTQAAGVGANYLINQPDIEATTNVASLGGIYVKQGTAQIVGGWLGGTVGLVVDALGSSVTMNGTIDQALVPAIISGAACSLIGCDIAGDNSTTTTGVLLNAGATDTQILGGRIRQFITEGVKFVGAPARCTVLVQMRSNGADITNPPPDLNGAFAPKGQTTPAPTAGAGVFTSAVAVVNWTKASNRAQVDVTVAITTNGTAATNISVTMPSFLTPSVQTAINGVVVETGRAVCGTVSPTGQLTMTLYDGTYPGADARTIRVQGAYSV